MTDNRHNPDFFLKVLLVDDEPDFIKYFGRIIRKCGHVYAGTTEPEKALELIKNAHDSKNPFDAAFIDILMPGKCGILVSKKMKMIDHDLIPIGITKDRSIKTRMKICDYRAHFMFIKKGLDLNSFRDLFNKLVDTKIEQCEGEASPTG